LEKLTRRWSILILLCFAGQAGPAHSQESLRWAADADGGVPYVFKDSNGRIVGFEKDLADALSRELNRPIIFKQYDFNKLIPGLRRGDFDFAMNGIEITPEREQYVRFTRPYYLYQQQLVVRAGEKRFKNLEEVKGLGLTIGTLDATVSERILDDKGIRKKTYGDQDGPYKDLSLGRQIDGVLLDLPAAIYYAAPDPYLKHGMHIAGLEFAGTPFGEGFYGIAVNKDNKELASVLDAALDQLIQSGELKKILYKWELWNPDQYRLYPKVNEVAVSEMTFWIYFPLLLDGAAVTVAITLLGMLLAVLLGLPIALARLYGPAPLRILAAVYVEFFRGIPVLLLLYFLYFGLAGISPHLSLGPFQAAVLGFGLNYAAYEAEIYRAGIRSIPFGQWEAAASLGMSTPLTFRRIILPQAIRVILPPMTNDFVALFKDTSVVSIIAVVELSKEYQILTKSGGGYLQIGLATAALYLIMSIPLGYLSRYLERRWAKGER
jgi:polar amino acid transport system substrate-binding protein